MPGNEESFEGETGLLDDYDATIVEAWFAPDQRFSNNLCLQFKLLVDAEEGGEPEEIEELWSCGPDWESMDGGETAEHPKGKGKFNKASKVQRMISSAVEAGAGPVLAGRGTAMEAKIWNGLRFHFKRTSYDYTYQGAEGKSQVLGMRAFLGEEDAASSSPSGSGSSGSAEPKPAAASALDGLDSEVVEALKTAKAEAGDSHNSFVDKAMELTAVTSNPTLMVAIADPDGLWKEL